MPAEQEGRWPLTTVGWIVTGSVVLLVAVLALFLRASGLGVFSNKLTVRTYFTNADSLKTGAEVDLDGVPIGTVKSVTVTTDPERKRTPVQVVMKIDSKYQSGLHTDSTASLITVGVLGDQAIDINSTVATGPMLQDGDELPTLDVPTVADTMKAGEVAANDMNILEGKLNKIVDGIQSGKGTLGEFATDKSFQQKLSSTASGVAQVEARLNAKDSTAGKLMNDPQWKHRMTAVSAGIQGLDADIAKRSGGELKQNIAETGKQVNAITAGIRAGQGSVGMLMKDPAMRQNLSDVLSRSQQLAANLNQGQGSLGKLLTDDQVQKNLTRMESESNALATMLRKNPMKYISIQFRIF